MRVCGCRQVQASIQAQPGRPRPGAKVRGGNRAGGSSFARGCTVQSRVAPLSDLYDSHYRELIRVAALLTGDTAAVEQIVQRAFADTYRACARLGADRKLAYLRRRVVLRARARRAAGVGTLSWVATSGIGVDADGRALAAAIATLTTVPNLHLEAIVLRYYANLTDAEIAASLAISVRSVRRYLVEGLAVFGAALPGI
jgi:DNA-directed RNA polymerase specialized sigma24 family protein